MKLRRLQKKMFREYIRNPIDPIPKEYTDTLIRLDYEPDYSLTCLGIALLRTRIKDYKGIAGTYTTFQDEDYCVVDLEDRMSKNNFECPTLYYYIYAKKNDNQEPIIKKLKNNGLSCICSHCKRNSIIAFSLSI